LSQLSLRDGYIAVLAILLSSWQDSLNLGRPERPGRLTFAACPQRSATTSMRRPLAHYRSQSRGPESPALVQVRPRAERTKPEVSTPTSPAIADTFVNHSSSSPISMIAIEPERTT
jgi:hypothetical protein